MLAVDVVVLIVGGTVVRMGGRIWIGFFRSDEFGVSKIFFTFDPNTVVRSVDFLLIMGIMDGGVEVGLFECGCIEMGCPEMNKGEKLLKINGNKVVNGKYM
jgi:hypothetical protein